MKKPTVSEIRARTTCMCLVSLTPADKDYLLDLVERLGNMTSRLVFRHHSSEHNGPLEDCDYPKCRAARELLKELKQ